MKHVFASAGLLALGATALYAYDPEMTRQVSGRPWTVAATVRGFYDDNVNTSPNGQFVPGPAGLVKIHPREESFGYEVSPSAHLSFPLEQTYIALGYIYSLKWYDKRDPDIDQSHEFNGKLRHQFSPRHDIGVDDSFVISSEPTVVDQGQIITAPTRLRSRSDVLHNRGAIEDNWRLTRTFGLSFGYVNNWYDYEAEGGGSRSALLDRLEHAIRLDARYQFTPSVVGLVGYTLGINSYIGDDFLLDDLTRANLQATLDAGGLTAGQRQVITRQLNLESDDRDSLTHYAYVGADVDLSTQLRASARVGAQFADFHQLNESSANPYADASLTYVYLPGSSVEAGVRHARNATDVASVDSGGQPTLDAESTVVYAQVIHRITRKLQGTVVGQFQMSDFNEGGADGETEYIYLIGVNLAYAFNRHFAADAGYNYDMLCSDLGRTYYRNRVYIGLRVTY